ncbi:hypothetical protein PZL33_07435 [Staphylococcus hominis]|uniref:hypothetical protein n=1 Tax=Staphylococcus hominis TaxID=1290 RepID=UPI00206711A1|nr:hypothetical protein [Staphylococcus hominis]MDH9922001.1 hypothetical protein [Staphylococcus hominis]MDH9924048.1 hypothetical protein [Staphylococcus hominis]MDH9949604.1 hypothetical protein [Staphylococcus hominis]DAL39809.1 MAG TPA_asm: hypothetical protein [Caudoviricetes sp.]
MGRINWIMPCLNYWRSDNDNQNDLMIEKPLENLKLKNLDEEVTIHIIISLSNYNKNSEKKITFMYGHISEEDSKQNGFELEVYLKNRILLSLPNITFEKTGEHFMKAILPGGNVATSYFNVEKESD